MKVRKSTLWRAPVYCWIAGFISFRLQVALYSRFAVVRDAENMVSIDPVKSLVIGGVILALALAGGRFAFRGMTRKEIFCSASIIVVFELLLLLAQQCIPALETGISLWYLYADHFTDWNGGIITLLFQIGAGTLAAALVGCFTPYLFVLFGGKE